MSTNISIFSVVTEQNCHENQIKNITVVKRLQTDFFY